MQSMAGGQKFSFPTLLESYRESFLSTLKARKVIIFFLEPPEHPVISSLMLPSENWIFLESGTSSGTNYVTNL